MSCGIYKMTNKVNGKIYIGLSVNIETRMYNHYRNAFYEKDVEYNSYLSRAIRKYGQENFSYEIIEECSISELPIRERYWISYYNSTDRSIGYNISRKFWNNGYMTEGEINPSSYITTDVGIKYLISILGYKNVASLPATFTTGFVDEGMIKKEYLGFSAIAKGFGIMKGNAFLPDRILTRALTAEILYNLISDVK